MDAAGHVIYRAAHLLARATEEPTPTTNTSSSSTASSAANATSTASPQTEGRPHLFKIVGVILALCSGFFIGISFVVKKVGLLKANAKYNEEAGEGYGYLKNAWWWLGMILMIVGEICNFVAYAFTDAILVTPLGALAVVICAILSSVFLKERLSFVGWVACFLCIVGSVIITINAPEQSAVSNIQEMQRYVVTPGFLTYGGIIIVGCIIVACYVAPRYGKKSMMVYLTICSLIGGLSVVATQGLGAAIIAQINGESQFNRWFLWVLFVFVICTLLTEIIYLNKALNLFNAAVVTPTYYVYFTSSTLVASAVLFQGFQGTTAQIIDVVNGFLVICSGVILLQLAKSAKDVPDTQVLSGELDQIRAVAEQEESEYEPRADTLRGGAGIVRAMSTVRTQREADEAKRMYEERMEAIEEDGSVTWDGLRRRKTASTQGAGSVHRQKLPHPPLGMTQAPAQEAGEPDVEMHPGFFGRMQKSFGSSQGRSRGHSPVPMDSVSVGKTDRVALVHAYGLPEDLPKDRLGQYDDIAYLSSGLSDAPHIHWAAVERGRANSEGCNLAPPIPPVHGTQRRQFSFQNVFARKKSSASEDRPMSRGALSFASRRGSHEYPTGTATTEEERLGLVQGDSHKQLPKFDEEDTEDWHVASLTGLGSPEQLVANGDLGQRLNRDSFDKDDDDEDLYTEVQSTTPRPAGDSAGEACTENGERAFV